MPTEEVTAFPFGEGGGFADGRGHCLPFRGRWRLCRRKRSLPSLSGKVAASPTEEVCTAISVPTCRNLSYFLRRVRRLLMIFPSNEILSRHCVPLSPKGKALIGTACHSPRRGKLFCRVGRLFLLSSIKTSGKTFFSSTQSKQAGRLFSLRLNQNEREDFQ